MNRLFVNGKEYKDTTSVKLYNLFNHLLYCLDVFVSSEDYEAYDWLLTPLGSGLPKITLQFDNDINRSYPIKYGEVGESFSNPITYTRDTNSAETTLALPTNQPAYQKQVQFIAGSNQSSVGANWAKLPAETDPTDTEMAYSHGINVGYENSVKDDYVLLKFNANVAVPSLELDTFMPRLTFVASPSLHNQLQHGYMNFNDQKESPEDQTIGVRYT